MIKLIKRSLQLTTQRVAAMAMLLALFIVFSLISKFFSFPIFPAANFLRLEYVDFWDLVAFHLVGAFYGSWLIIVNSWMRVAYCGDGPIDAFAIMLAGLIFLWSYGVCNCVLHEIYFLFKHHQRIVVKSWDYSMMICSCAVGVIITAILMGLFNYLFIYDWYVYYLNMQDSLGWLKGIIVPIVVPFNVIKYALNSVFFIMIYRVVIILMARSSVIKSGYEVGNIAS